MGSGVGKSGSPTEKSMTSMPPFFISEALALILKVGERVTLFALFVSIYSSLPFSSFFSTSLSLTIFLISMPVRFSTTSGS